MVSYEEIKKNPAINTYIRKADESLRALGYTEHSFAHVGNVAATAEYILRTMGYSEHDIETAKIAAYLDEVAKGGGAQPTVDELAEKFGCERCDIVFALDTSRFVVSLSDDSGEDGAPLEDRIAGGSTPEDGIDGLMLRESIMQLPERERKIIFLRYYRDKTQSEVAGELGVSQVQVSRLENKILCKIREKMDAGE